MFKKIACVCLSIFPLVGVAQLNNPYTISGIGETNHINNATFSGYGDASVAYAKPSILNLSNPASFSFLKHQFPIFSVGTGTKFNKVTDGNETSSSNFTGIPEIGLGLSFAKRFGIAFALKPFSNKNYSITTMNPIGTDTIMHKYIGSGSINQVSGGLSFKITKSVSLKAAFNT